MAEIRIIKVPGLDKEVPLVAIPEKLYRAFLELGIKFLENAPSKYLDQESLSNLRKLKDNEEY